MRKTAIFLIVGILAAASPARAERIEWLDEDKDGKNEMKVTYSQGSTISSLEIDKNGDAKPDRFVRFKSGTRHTAEDDTNFNGKPDSWSYYNSKGALVLSAKDRNHDGKPDDFKKMVMGRQVVLSENDKNFDGRIDRRKLAEWGMIRRSPGMSPEPGYKTIWREEDKDFDGVVDVYYEKGNPEAAKQKIGKPIDAAHAQKDDEKPEPAPAAGDGLSQSERLVKSLNQRYGFDEEPKLD